MKDEIHQWFHEMPHYDSFIACAVRFPDCSTVTESRSPAFSFEAMEHALRCAADLFEVLEINHFNFGRVRWIFHEALFHCEHRADGLYLGLFTKLNLAEHEFAEVERLFEKFHSLGKP